MRDSECRALAHLPRLAVYLEQGVTPVDALGIFCKVKRIDFMEMDYEYNKTNPNRTMLSFYM